MAKEFKTLTIRDLDTNDNQDIVKIMNDVMNYYDLKTGQQVFEKVVREYDFLKDKLRNEEQKRQKEVSELKDKCFKIEQELKKYKKFHLAFSVLQDAHSEIIDSKN